MTEFLKSCCCLAVLLLAGMFLRAKIPAFRKLFLPAAVLGGFLGLILGPRVLGDYAVLRISDEWLTAWSALPGVLVIPIFAAGPMGVFSCRKAETRPEPAPGEKKKRKGRKGVGAVALVLGLETGALINGLMLLRICAPDCETTALKDMSVGQPLSNIIAAPASIIIYATIKNCQTPDRLLTVFVAAIDRYEEELCRLSDDIWEHPELSYQEEFAAGRLCRALELHGFAVERGVGGLPPSGTQRPGCGDFDEHRRSVPAGTHYTGGQAALCGDRHRRYLAQCGAGLCRSGLSGSGAQGLPGAGDLGAGGRCGPGRGPDDRDPGGYPDGQGLRRDDAQPHAFLPDGPESAAGPGSGLHRAGSGLCPQDAGDPGGQGGDALFGRPDGGEGQGPDGAGGRQADAGPA